MKDGSDTALLYLGQVYAAENEADQAKSCFEQYMDKYPKDAAALSHLGELAMNLGEYADAVTYFDRAVEAAGDNAQNIRRSLIAACEKSGDFGRALEEAEDYLEDYSNDDGMQRELEFLRTRIVQEEKPAAEKKGQDEKASDTQGEGTSDTQDEGTSDAQDTGTSDAQDEEGSGENGSGENRSDTENQ